VTYPELPSESQPAKWRNVYRKGAGIFRSGSICFDQKAKEPLIRADLVPLICADLRTEGCVNQRFLLRGKTI
jgi:hypothetical protein